VNQDAAADVPLTSDAPQTYWRVEPRDPGDDGLRDINFVVEHPNAPVEQRVLKNEVERVLTVVRTLYVAEDKAPKFNEAYAKLLSLSQVGLVGRNASPSIATDALRSLEADILSREAGPIKNAYMRKLGSWALLFSVAALALYAALDALGRFTALLALEYRAVLLVWVGCMTGAWASFATRKVKITFDDLVALEEDRVEPWLRLVFTGTLTGILTLIFLSGMVEVKVGGFSSAQLLTSPVSALLIGAFAGLAEKALPSAVMARATSVISSAGTQRAE
jgi:hypothetical protein